MALSKDSASEENDSFLMNSNDKSVDKSEGKCPEKSNKSTERPQLEKSNEKANRIIDENHESKSEELHTRSKSSIPIIRSTKVNSRSPNLLFANFNILKNY